MEENEIKIKINNCQKAINVLKENNVGSISIFKNTYSELMCSEWDLYNLRMGNISKTVKDTLEQSLGDFPNGEYQYKITLIKDINGNTHIETTTDNSKSVSDWSIKKDFALDKFNQIGILFEKINDSKFDIWRMNNIDFNVHYTDIDI